jgi:hypothetical protein
LEKLHFAARIELLAMTLNQGWFVVERVALAGRSGHEQLYDTLCLGRVVRSFENAPCRSAHSRAEWSLGGLQQLVPGQQMR